MIDIDSLKYLPQSKFLRERPVMVITDLPLGIEMQQKAAFSSPSANMMFSEFAKVGVSRLQIHASYLFNFRPEKGDLSALFHQPGLPVSEYTAWPQSKKDAILNFAYNDLKNLREVIKEVNPSLIVCAGRWSLYFLTGETTFAETKKSAFGTLLKWRASHLTLGDFWQYNKPHVVMPILPQQAVWNLPEYTIVIRQDYARIGLMVKEVLASGSVEAYTEAGRNYQFIVKPSFMEAKQFLLDQLIKLEKSTKPIYYAVDVETRQGYHDCVGIAWSETEAICIPWAGCNNPLLWTEQEEIELNYLLMQFLNHKNCAQIGQNYSYDMQYFWRDLAIQTKPAIDTMVQQHSMFSCMEKNLAFLSSLYAKVYRYWKDEGAFHKGKTDQEHWIYNCKDCCYTFEIALVMQSMLAKSPKNIQKAYKFQLEETLPALVNIMNRGVRANRKEKSRLYSELTSHMAVLQNELNTIIGEPFNPNSAPQKLALFYDLFQLPKQFDPKTKRPSAGAGALTLLAEQFPLVKPIADRVSEFGNLKTFSSTFLKAGLDIDGRMRTAYNLCGTDTYRLSSRQNAFGSGMNLQNIPSGGITALGRELPNCKKLFIPDEGKTFFDIDLDSADLRVVVAISGAKGLQQMLDENLKPYIEMIKEYYHDPTADKHHPQYRTFKAVCHGTNYLGSPTGLAARVGLLVHEVERLQKWYLQANPEIARWHTSLKAQVMKRGWIENIFGYRMYFLNKNHPTLMNIAAACEPQSTVGLLINKGMVKLDQAYMKQESKVEVLLQVHDSLAGQYPTANPECRQEIINACEIELPYKHPITIPVDIHTSTENWGECK